MAHSWVDTSGGKTIAVTLHELQYISRVGGKGSFTEEVRVELDIEGCFQVYHLGVVRKERMVIIVLLYSVLPYLSS